MFTAHDMANTQTPTYSFDRLKFEEAKAKKAVQ